MADVLTASQRRLNMSRIRGRDTKPEMLIRRGLHRLGYRYRLDSKDLPGSPDIVLPRYRVVIFVHGCFWHGHDCALFKLPQTRREFWSQKISGNRARDERALSELAALGWRSLVIWECALRGTRRQPMDHVLRTCEEFLGSASKMGSIAGAVG